jgi:hypothetical protein
VPQTNLDLAEEIDRLLRAEKKRGPSITSTIESAVYWFLHRLTPQEREWAREECQELIRTGKVPIPKLGSELVQALHTGQGQGSQQSDRKIEGDR